MYRIRIRAQENLSFPFPIQDKTAAWYELDHAEAFCGDCVMELNADREVYAVITRASGEKIYGTVGDRDNVTLADNDAVCADGTYLLYENPDTEEYYV